ncbi:MAG: geranylgeranyl pyrophosphate synthase [Bacteriovoracaceae bacterium]|jgi:geranylgeranyl pyrophosphate synthase
MKIDQLQKNIEAHLEVHLRKMLPKHSISEAYLYASLPPGKLFRPLLSAGVFLFHNPDQVGEFEDHQSAPSKLASFLELHHAYTLVHDDMPCMDDDDMRRGKPSTHKKFGQWQALLVGDGLLGASWQLLTQIKHKDLLSYLNYATWCLGPKGLLQGQVLDLSEEMTLSFENLIETHKLKTARLIQASLVGGYLLSPHPNMKTAKAYHRLGEALGISFQLLDDLTELTESLGEHEKKVNPWIWAKTESTRSLIDNLNLVTKLVPKEAELLQEILALYFKGISKKIGPEMDPLNQFISDEDLRPIISLLKVLGHA